MAARALLRLCFGSEPPLCLTAELSPQLWQSLPQGEARVAGVVAWLRVGHMPWWSWETVQPLVQSKSALSPPCFVLCVFLLKDVLFNIYC